MGVMADEVDEKDIPGFLRGIEASKLIAQDVYDDGYRDGWNEAIRAAAQECEKTGLSHAIRQQEHEKTGDKTAAHIEGLITGAIMDLWERKIRALTKEETE